MSQEQLSWGERYLYAPSFFQKLLSFILFPFSLLYCIIAWIRYKQSIEKDFEIPVVSVGNLTVGGSGKTPLVSALVQYFSHSAIILRGYGRQSKGLIVVRDWGKVCVDVYQSGDEAMIYATRLNNTLVIVSEDREQAILKAKEMGAKLVFLDDGYGKHHIKKLDLLIDVETPNTFCLPSGAYREKLWSGKEAVILKEGRDFIRKTILKDAGEKMSLVTAIARPQRLENYLPSLVAKHYFKDHYFFKKSELEAILDQDKSDTLLVTYKDFVKIAPMKLPLSLLDLELEVKEEIIEIIQRYINERKN